MAVANENEKLQAEAVEAVESEIKAAKTLQEDRLNVMDKMRKAWERIAYQSTLGSWGVKLFLTLIVFLSLYASMRYGLLTKAGLISEGIARLPAVLSENPPLTVLAAAFLGAAIWLFIPNLGMPICTVLLYMSFGGIAPVALLLAFVLLLLFQFEDRPVTALLLAMPALTFLTPLRVGLFLTILAGFIATRKHNGIVKSLGLVYFALLELCSGCFGTVSDSGGHQVIPTVGAGIRPLVRLKVYFGLLENGIRADSLFGPILLMLAIFLAVGLVYSKLLELRYAPKVRPVLKRMNIDVKDGILFAVLLALLCAVPAAVARFTILTEFGYGYVSIAVQVAAAYIISRPFAGKSPHRGEAVLEGDRNYIFISYAHSDIDIIKPYLKILSRNGYEFWYDDNIRTGTEWQGVIASNLTNCTCFLAFVSKSSVASDYCLKEINYAASKKKPMAVIQLEDAVFPPVLEMIFASLQIVQRKKYGTDEECMEKVFSMEKLKDCQYEKEKSVS